MKLTVERIGTDFVILEKEDFSRVKVDISVLPSGLKEGNVLIFDGSEYRCDADAEAQARKRIIEKQRTVFKKK